MTEKREYKGAAPKTQLTSGITNSSSSFTVANGSGFPAGGSGRYFYVIIDKDLASEEKVRCSARSTNTFTVATRGADNTSAASHGTGATVEHVWTADDAQILNDHATDVTKDDHTQYMRKDAYPLQGLYSARPSAATVGRHYFSTDHGQMDYDNGNRWYTLSTTYWEGWTLDWGTGIGAEPGADYTVHVDGVDNAEYQITGDKCYFSYAALWRFTGPTNPSNAFGVVINLPISAHNFQGVFSADVENGVGRCILRNQDQLLIYPQSVGYPNRWTVDNFARWVRLSGWYRLLNP